MNLLTPDYWKARKMARKPVHLYDPEIKTKK